MTGEEIVEKIKADKGREIVGTEISLGDAVVHILPQSLHAVAKHLRDDPDLNFHYLSHLTGVDYLDQEREPRFEVVYELHSLDKNHSVRIRVGISEEDPSIPTVIDLWPSATFPERELFDMFGIGIIGHPDLRRLLMPEDWEGHPLRRDYSLTQEEIAFSHNIDFKREFIKEKEPERYRPDVL
tara:strand:- start:706 stop:1254 length:549 start_codon:yes stop_codon:yes gene_type:complete